MSSPGPRQLAQGLHQLPLVQRGIEAVQVVKVLIVDPVEAAKDVNAIIVDNWREERNKGGVIAFHSSNRNNRKY